MTHTGTIFEHEDSAGDKVRFSGWRYAPEDGGRPSVIVTATSHDDRYDFLEVSLQEPDVRRLHSALGRWLTENGITMERAEDVNPFVKPAPSVGGDDRLRSVIREEILEALLLLKATADYCDIPYGTPELDSRAYRAIETVAEQAAASWKDAR